MKYLLIPEIAIRSIETSVQVPPPRDEVVLLDVTVELSILEGDPRYRVQYVDIVDGTVVHAEYQQQQLTLGVGQGETDNRSDSIRGIEAPFK